MRSQLSPTLYRSFVVGVDIVTDGDSVAYLHSGDQKHAAVPRLAPVGGEVEAEPVPGGGQHLGEAALGSPEVILLTQVTRVAVNIEYTKTKDTYSGSKCSFLT